VRDVPLVAQLARLLSAHRQGSQFARGDDWVFATARGTPYGHRNVSRRALGRAAQLAGLNDDGWPALRFHDLRHTFASHLIIDLGLDPAQVSRILGHARVTITLDIYTHLFEDARHARDIRTRMAASPFAGLLEPTTTSPGATGGQAPTAQGLRAVMPSPTRRRSRNVARRCDEALRLWGSGALPGLVGVTLADPLTRPPSTSPRSYEATPTAPARGVAAMVPSGRRAWRSSSGPGWDVRSR
jgi:hypothetical protein